MPRRPLSTALLLALVASSSFSAAWAEAPFSLESGQQIADQADAFSSQQKLDQALEDLSSSEQVNLYLVTIEEFEDPSSPQSWARSFANLNNLGSNEVLLVIATQERSAYFVAGSTNLLSSSEQEAIYQDYIYPQLKNSNYQQAALAAAEGISQTLGSSGQEVSSTSSWGQLLGPVGLGAAGFLTLGGVGAGIWAMSRSRKSRPTGSTRPSPSRPSAQQAGLHPSLAGLRAQADRMLVATDDAISHAQQEVEFARLQYGPQEVAPYLAAIDSARQQMQASFQLQKQLDDHIPDTLQEQDAWLKEIIQRTSGAQRALKEQVDNFARLRQLEQKAPQALETLREQISQVQALFPRAQQALDSLRANYAPTAFGTVAGNLTEAQKRLAFAQEEAQETQDLLQSNRSQAIITLRAAEEATGQARGLLAAVDQAAQDLAAMTANLDQAFLLADRDIASAQELARVGAGPSQQLQGAAAGLEAVLGQIKAERSAGLFDPYLLNQRLHEVRTDLDQALEAVRQERDQDQAARQALAQTILSAQAQVSATGEFIWARRGGVKAPARTRLREAERHLDQARSLEESKPQEAQQEAQQAMHLALEARQLAEQDVSHFSQNRSEGSSSFNSALLGGILLGGLMNSSSHASSSMGGGIFNGGFGGGFGGDFGGDFGSDGGAGGSF